MNRIVRILRLRAATAAAVVGLGLLAPGAHAGLLVESATSCPPETLELPFLRWADPASYVLAPDGTLESAGGWRLSRATRVLGNEPYFVHAAGERYSLALPPGSSATTATMCVGIEHPTLRLFARNTGSPLSLLGVDVIVRSKLGLLSVVPVGAIAATATWAPTLPLPLVANLLPLLPGDRTPIALRFTPLGSGGNWQIDDVYVDPYRK
jgi:hypothetical protein